MSATTPSSLAALSVPRPTILPKPVGRGGGGAISLGFERHHGFYELVCARFAPPGGAFEFVSRDFGYIDVARRASTPPARKERKIALLIFFLMLEDVRDKTNCGLVEIGRGGASTWCHSLYRLSVHNPKEGVGNKWLGAALGLHEKFMDDPFAGVLRFIQCRRAGKEFLVHLDCTTFDPASVVVSMWAKGEWDHSPRLRLEILYDLMRQVPRWSPVKMRGYGTDEQSVLHDAQVPAPWEDMPVFLRYIQAASKVQMVGLNHQVFRRVRWTWMQETHGAAPFDYRALAAISASETAAERERRIAMEISAHVEAEPLNEALEEFTVFVGSQASHNDWERETQWRPETHEASLEFWRLYMAKVARLRPKARIRLFVSGCISPLTLHLEFPDGSAFLKWAPAMYGAYHPGNPGWNLWWNLAAPPPPHFKEIVGALLELEKRCVAIPMENGAAKRISRRTKSSKAP